MTKRHQRPGTIPRSLALAVLLLAALPLTAAAPGTDLWGGPAAKGAGVGARFDSNIYLSGTAAASGTVDFWAGGVLVESVPFSVPANGSIAVPAPAALDDQGPFLWHVRSDTPLGAWSETFNDSAAGRYGLSLPGFASSDFLRPGDEADGGGAEASSSTEPGRARTNVGLLCSPAGTDSCSVDVAAFDGGTLLGTDRLTAAPGAVAQRSLAALIPDAAGRSLLTLRFRLLSGSGQPYAVRNDNLTSDGTAVPLAVSRAAFSTAPTIDSFTLTPTSGCAPLTATATWSTSGAAGVTITGLPGNLPPSGTASVTVLTTQDVVLTAIAPSGQTTSQPRHVSVAPPVDPPTPVPSTATISIGTSVNGKIPATSFPVTTSFDNHESTGSTFTITGTSWTYVSGTTTGTDVVRITVTGPCGDVSSTFTVTVQESGPPIITRFEADPMAGCGPSANIVLSWATLNAVKVSIPEVTTAQSFPPNGATGVTITASSTFTLIAYNAAGESIASGLTVPVDPQFYVPVLDMDFLVVPRFGSAIITATGVPDLTLLRIVYVKNDSGGSLQYGGTPGQFAFSAGSGTGEDIFRIFYTNGCGSAFAELHITVTP